MKSKIIMAAGIMALTVVLVAGISYAWLTDKHVESVAEIRAGYLKISLEGNPDETESIFPAEDGKTIEYKITNLSEREAVVQFKVGTLTAYVMPDDYLDKDGFIIKDENDYHGEMRNLTADHKMKLNGLTSDFIEKVAPPLSDVAYGIEGDWLLEGGSVHLGKDSEGNQYFRMPGGGTATGVFKVALTEDAENEYQYALFTLSEASAYATLNNTEAIAATFNVDINIDLH